MELSFDQSKSFLSVEMLAAHCATLARTSCEAPGAVAELDGGAWLPPIRRCSLSSV